MPSVKGDEELILKICQIVARVEIDSEVNVLVSSSSTRASGDLSVINHHLRVDNELMSLLRSSCTNR
jgi:hypothetical protein